jgi:hypothetical protein
MAPLCVSEWAFKDFIEAFHMWNRLSLHLVIHCLVLGASAVALAGSASGPGRFDVAQIAQPAAAQEAWQKVKAFGVELEVPARWKRVDIRKPSSDHDETEFAENPRNVPAGAWFSVFPNSDDLIDPDHPEQKIVLDGRPALLTDILSRADDPPPRRRQVVIYLSDKAGPAFLFDGDADKWPTLGPILAHIQASIRLPK